MMMIFRGRSSAATKSSIDSVAVMAPSSPNSSTKSRVFAGVRLWTAME